jgi:hypothetical protein
MSNSKSKPHSASHPAKEHSASKQDGKQIGSTGSSTFLQHRTVEELAAEQGVAPLDEATLDAMGDVWPEHEDLDEFLAWLRKSRREGRY